MGLSEFFCSLFSLILILGVVEIGKRWADIHKGRFEGSEWRGCQVQGMAMGAAVRMNILALNVFKTSWLYKTSLVIYDYHLYFNILNSRILYDNISLIFFVFVYLLSIYWIVLSPSLFIMCLFGSFFFFFFLMQDC